MRQHDFVLTFAFIVALHDPAAEQRLHAQRGKERRLDARCPKYLRFFVTCESKCRKVIDRTAFEDRVLLLPVQVIRCGERKARHSRKTLRRRHMPQLYEPLRLSERKRPDENSVNK